MIWCSCQTEGFFFFSPRAILLTHQDGNRKGEHSRAQALNPLRASQSVPCQPSLGSDELLACTVQALLNTQVEMIPPQQAAWVIFTSALLGTASPPSLSPGTETTFSFRTAPPATIFFRTPIKIFFSYLFLLKQNWFTGFPSGTSGKEPSCQCKRYKTWVRSLGQQDSLAEEMTTHSRILAWRIPWTKEPGGLQSMELKSQTRLSDWAHHSAWIVDLQCC